MTDFQMPVALPPRRLTDDWTLLPSWLPLPGMGGLPVKCFLLKGCEPVLVDTGLGALGDAVVQGLGGEIDPADLRWIWLSHTDPDHIGNLRRILDLAPRAQVVTSFLGAGKMFLAGMELDRVRVLADDEVLDAGGRRLHPVRPPYFDAPETLGFYDATGRVLFAADCFGAVMDETAETAEDIPDGALAAGMTGWALADSPWLAAVDGAALGRSLSAIRRLDPALLLSGHLPPARAAVGAILGHLGKALVHGAAPAPAAFSLEVLVDSLDRAAA